LAEQDRVGPDVAEVACEARAFDSAVPILLFHRQMAWAGRYRRFVTA